MRFYRPASSYCAAGRRGVEPDLVKIANVDGASGWTHEGASSAQLSAVLRPDFLPGSILLLMLPMNAYVAWRERAFFDLPSTSWITAGRFVGTFFGL